MSSRRKSCRHCSIAKARCDLGRPRCGRCTLRGTTCLYASPQPLSTIGGGSSGTLDGARNVESTCAVPSTTESLQEGSSLVERRPDNDSSSMFFDFGAASQDGLVGNSNQLFSEAALNDLDLDTGFLNLPAFPFETGTGSPLPLSSTKMEPRKLLAIEILNNTGFDEIMSASPMPRSDNLGKHAKAIANRLSGDYELSSAREWLSHPCVTLPGNYTPDKSSTIFFNRIIHSYPRMLASGSRTPPMFHHSQLAPHCVREPMANCITIARMWHSQREPSKFAVETLQREMNRLFNEVFPSMLYRTQPIADKPLVRDLLGAGSFGGASSIAPLLHHGASHTIGPTASTATRRFQHDDEPPASRLPPRDDRPPVRGREEPHTPALAHVDPHVGQTPDHLHPVRHRGHVQHDE